LREALAPWRGLPLADLGLETLVQMEVVRLEENRLAANPTHERLAVQLMLCRPLGRAPMAYVMTGQ
jgi:hypothetical protein